MGFMIESLMSTGSLMSSSICCRMMLAYHSWNFRFIKSFAGLLTLRSAEIKWLQAVGRNKYIENVVVFNCILKILGMHALALEIIKNYKSRILRVETKFLSFFEHINISDHG